MILMPMSKKQLEKNKQKQKAEAAELEKAAANGDNEAKRKLEKLQKKMAKKLIGNSPDFFESWLYIMIFTLIRKQHKKIC